jgi:hypothetical protein
MDKSNFQKGHLKIRREDNELDWTPFANFDGPGLARLEEHHVSKTEQKTWIYSHCEVPDKSNAEQTLTTVTRIESFASMRQMDQEASHGLRNSSACEV